MKNILSEKKINSINKLCDKYNISKYTINQDATINVSGSVNLSHYNFKKLPINFNEVKGDFICYTNNLNTLDGCPRIVYGSFNISYNPLTSLIGSPKFIQGEFTCTKTLIESFEGFPDKVMGNIYAKSCNKLTTLKGIPNEINGGILVFGDMLKSLEYYPSNFKFLLPILYNSKLPAEFTSEFTTLNKEEQIIFIKYQKHYDVWNPNLSVDSMHLLIDDIRGGLL